MTLTFRPGDDVLERLKAYCAREDVRPSQIARKAIIAYLEKLTGSKLAKK